MSATHCEQLIERGISELQSERYARAAGTLSEALELAPNDAEILSLLGLALLRSGRSEEAAASLKRAVEIEPHEIGLVMNLAEWQASNGQLGEAIAGLRAALARDPARPRAWDRLGELLLRQGDAVGAVQAFDRMLQADPRNPAGPAKLCTALIAARDWVSLARVAEAWSTVDEGSADAWRSRSRAAWEQGLFRVAIDHGEKVLALRPTDVDERVRVARMCLQAQDFGRAAALLEEAARQARGHPDVLSALAMLWICKARFDEAERALLESLSVSSGNIPALTLLGRLRGGRFDEAQYWALRQAADDSRLPPEWRIGASFALGDARHARGEHDAAFASWRLANTRVQERNAAEGIRYDPAHTEARIDRILATWPQAPASAGLSSGSSLHPIFIVGMPRSGTTLVEAVLAAHPEVAAGGERQLLRQALDARLQLQAAPDASLAQAWRDACFADIHLPAGIRCVTDKNPLNLEAVGLIAELFPDAPILYLVRDPIACGFSVFRHEFQKFWAFAQDLDDIAHYQAQCARLGTHWGKILGDRFVTIRYEDFAGRFPAGVEPLLQACGLPWSERCVHFQAHPSQVATLSAVEVRGPVRVRNESHAPYATELAPLREALMRYGLDATG